MAQITKLAQVLNGLVQNISLTTDQFAFGSVMVGGASGTELTKTILDNLVNLQNGTDFADGTNSHTHDGRYFTEAELGSSSASSGSDLIGDDATYSNFTPTAATVKGALSGIDAALVGSGSTQLDGSFRIENTSDPTKEIAFDASGIATGTTRTISMPDSNVDLGKVGTAIQKDGSVTFTADQAMGSHKLTGLSAGSGAGDSVRYEQAILTSGANAFGADQSLGSHKLTNVADPASAQDAATKAYVDSVADGRAWKDPVRVASTANIDLSVAADPSPVDGVTLADGDRILLKDQTAPAENGIYTAVTAADPTTWLRAHDADTALELTGAAVFVEEGTASHDYQFAQTAINIVLGVTSIVWVVTSANSFSGHDMISITGGQISVDLAAASGLESTNPGNAAGQLRVKLEASNPSLKFTGSNELAAKLDPAGAITSGGSGLAVGVDGSTIEISSDALRVKASGITANELATNAVTTLKIADANVTLAKLASDSVDENKIKSSSHDATMTGGSGTVLSVASAPLTKKSMIAGESMAANTSFLVRWAVTGETAGRVYKATNAAAATDGKFWAHGIALKTASVSAGDAVDVVALGTSVLGSSDTPFSSGDVGKAVWLTTGGGFSITAPSTAATAAYKVGIVENTDRIWMGDKQLTGIN